MTEAEIRQAQRDEDLREVLALVAQYRNRTVGELGGAIFRHFKREREKAEPDEPDSDIK